MKQIHKSKETGVVSKCLVGLAISCASSIVIAAAVAALIVNETFRAGVMGIASTVVQLIATFLGVFYVSKQAKDKKFPACLAVVFLYYFILVGCTILVWDGRFENVIQGMVSGLLGGVAGIMLGTSNRKTKRGLKRKVRSR